MHTRRLQAGTSAAVRAGRSTCGATPASGQQPPGARGCERGCGRRGVASAWERQHHALGSVLCRPRCEAKNAAFTLGGNPADATLSSSSALPCSVPQRTPFFPASLLLRIFLHRTPQKATILLLRAAGVSYLSAAVLANPKKRPASTMLTALLGAGLGLTGKPQAQAMQGGPMPEVSTTPPRPSSTAPPPTQPHQINHRHDSCPAGEGERSPAARCPPEGRWLQTLPQGEVQR